MKPRCPPRREVNQKQVVEPHAGLLAQPAAEQGRRTKAAANVVVRVSLVRTGIASCQLAELGRRQPLALIATASHAGQRPRLEVTKAHAQVHGYSAEAAMSSPPSPQQSRRMGGTHALLRRARDSTRALIVQHRALVRVAHGARAPWPRSSSWRPPPAVDGLTASAVAPVAIDTAVAVADAVVVAVASPSLRTPASSCPPPSQLCDDHHLVVPRRLASNDARCYCCC